MKYFLSFPTLIIAMLLYVALGAGGSLDRDFFGWTVPSGDVTTGSASEFIILVAIPLFVIETWKSTSIGALGLIDHILSMALGVIALIAYMTAPAFGTITFLILTAMQFADVAAGVIVSIRAARRDFGIEA